MVSQVWIHETQERNKKTQFTILTGPTEGVTVCHTRVTGEVPGCGQVAEDRKEGKALGQNFYWGFLGEGKAGQGDKLGLASLDNFGGL